jgi:hypothetical protein
MVQAINTETPARSLNEPGFRRCSEEPDLNQADLGKDTLTG